MDAKLSQNFDKIILNFAKFEENFAKILQNYENENFAATLCRSGMRGGRAGGYSPGATSVLTQIVH